MADYEDINRKNMRGLLICLGAGAGMLALSFAAVPLYQVFCQVTGFGGTTQIAEGAPEVVLDRMVTVRFDANMSPDLGWEFEPEQISQTLHVGEVGVAFYVSENLNRQATTGVATFNVTPGDVGRYFRKIQCFCFNEQTLEAGERRRMPVYYYVDPEIAEEPSLDDIHTITLSYTFFPVETHQASSGAGAASRDNESVAMNTNMGHTGP